MSDDALLRVGQPAPSFTATGSDGQVYRLEDLLARGHVALFFYPGNNTPG
ncbi:MAG TPA: redoxin domain-containing protein [Gemmatimonadaceae bacterium]|nr:redoxin domain-containing protein [Gemmatimonadaceae bacterium]